MYCDSSETGPFHLVAASMLTAILAVVPLCFLMVSIGFPIVRAMWFALAIGSIGLCVVHICNVCRSDWNACAMNSRRLAEVSLEETHPRMVMAVTGGSTSPLSETSGKVAEMGSIAVGASRAEFSSNDIGVEHRPDQTYFWPVLLSTDQNPAATLDASLKGCSMFSEIRETTAEASVVINLDGTDSLPVLLSSGETISI